MDSKNVVITVPVKTSEGNIILNVNDPSATGSIILPFNALGPIHYNQKVKITIELSGE